MTKIYHVYHPGTNQDSYYGSIQAMIRHQGDALGIGENTLYRETWMDPRHTRTGAVIKRGYLHTVNTIKKKSSKRMPAKHIPTRKMK